MVLVGHVGYGTLVLDIGDIRRDVTIVLVDLGHVEAWGQVSGTIGKGRGCRVFLACGHYLVAGCRLGGLGALNGYLDVLPNTTRGGVHVHVPRSATRGLCHGHKQLGVPIDP